MNRPFNLARYDAGRTVAAFAGRLRDEVELDPLRTDLLATVAGTFGPSGLAVWLRDREPVA